MKKAYDIATSKASQARDRQKEGYDLKVRGSNISEGDRVLVKIVAFDGKHKIADRWEEDIYMVLRQPNSDIPVYEVQREDQEGRKRTLHRNLLLPIGHLESFKQTPPKPAPRKKNVPENKESDSRPVPRKRHGIMESETLIDEQDQYLSSQDTDSNDCIDLENIFMVPVPQMEQDIHTDDLEDVIDEQEGGNGDAQNGGSSMEETTHHHPLVEDSEMQDLLEVSGEDNSERDVGEENQLRRSTRVRKVPDWMTTGEYVVHSIQEDNWKQKVQYLQSLIITDLSERSTSCF